MNSKSSIILPLKESYSNIDFGAVSIWVKDYLNYSKNKKDIVFCKKLLKRNKYLTKNVYPISVTEKFFTNSNYIKKINAEIVKQKIKIVEIHNRPEYAIYLLNNNHDLKINIVFHNDPNTLRGSNSKRLKEKLLNKCNKIIFVSSWLKERFFYDLKDPHNNKTEIIYNFVKLIDKFPIKEKKIVFSGKLNKSKGYHIFGEAIIKVLNKYPNWFAEVYGNEQREKLNFKHARLEIKNWIDHKKLLKIYEKSSITVVNPTWEEPFGRTALESASRGCAVITSKKGGLSETFNNNLVLKNNNSNELFKLICKLIDNRQLLKIIQKKNFQNVIHSPSKSIYKLNALRNFKSLKIIKKKKFKIIHISNFGMKTNQRLFNLSIAKKISNGLIRNGHDVIDFDYRDFNYKIFNDKNINSKIISIAENYRPDLILLGHNNILNRNTILKLKDIHNVKFAIWYEDHVVKNDPNYKNNLNVIEKNNDLIDQYFVTTSPSVIKTKISNKKLNFLPIPVDPNIESGEYYEVSKTKDLFFALSHGVNYGKLKHNTHDIRFDFVNQLISKKKDNIDYHFLGIFNEQPKWNFEFEKELMICKTALNLSRGGPTKYCSSNRIASLMGNGVLPFIHEKVKYQDFFDNDEIITYRNSKNLINQLLDIKENNKLLIKRSKNAKKRYFELFENTIISDFIINKIFDVPKLFNYIWDK